MTSLKLLIFLTATLQPAGEGVFAANLDRLFYHPRERAALDAQRSQSAMPGMEGDTITVNGLVTRSSGRSTVWVNGVPQNEGEAGSVEILRKQAASGRVTIRPPANDQAVDLKVGQTLEGATGRVREAYEPASSPPSDEAEQ